MNAPNFRTLDLNLLRVFDEVMTERNLTRAARNLSHDAAGGEQRPAAGCATRWATSWCARSGYGVEPTPRALALWPSVRDALRQLEALAHARRLRRLRGHHHLRAGDGRRHGRRADAGPGRRSSRATRRACRCGCVPLTTRDPRQLLGRRPDGPGRRLLSRGAGRPDGAGPVRRAGGLRPPAAVRRRIRVRDAQGPSAGQRAVDAQALLRGAPPAGELFGPALRLHRRGAGRRWGASAASC